ncbi:uncharacterized protein LOC116163826 [Photinus pyralis]|uniref:uncharacterized protein LOC116163826 n=1 Tax=Photinus pyralis TaxID=7054 RepID=UPI00126775D1|nr:uncharacterized protein LOC116163826 [Photinus pyralis]
MPLKNGQILIIAVHVFALQLNNSCVCLKTKSEFSFRSITPNPKAMAVSREKLESVAKKESPDIPEGNIGVFVTNATFPLKTGIMKENCPAVLCVILHRKGKRSRATFNRVFYKLCRRCKKEFEKLTKDDVQRENDILNYASRKLVKRATEVGTMEHLVDHTEPSNEPEITTRNTSLTTTRSSILEFPDAPPGNLIKVLDLKLEEGYFRVFSDLIGYLQPASFPVDFLKGVLENQIPIHILIFKAIKIEGPVLCWLFVWLILSLALPCAIIAQTCCSKKGIQRLRDDYSITSRYTDKWMRNLNTCLMHLLLLLLLGSIALMITANEQISQTATTAPNRIKIMFEDIETFVDNTQFQISSVTTSSIQIATEAIHRDLEDGEQLLGNPLRQALHDETGIETAIQALPDLTAVAADLSFRVASLIKDCNKARSAGKSLQGSLTELSKLLTLTRQECLPRDRPLCDTLQTQPFAVTIYVDQLTSDYHLQQLEKMGTNENFNRTIEISQRTFQGLPKRVSLETAASRTGNLEYNKNLHLLHLSYFPCEREVSEIKVTQIIGHCT